MHVHVARRVTEPAARDQVVAREVVGRVGVREVMREKRDRKLECGRDDDQCLGPSDTRSQRRNGFIDHRGNVGLSTPLRNVQNGG